MPAFRATLIAVALLIAGCAGPDRTAANERDPAAGLASWNAGDARQNIATFIERTTTPSSPDFVPVAERIAVFDNDGCLWAEQPMYFQLLFAVDRVRTLAPDNPEWRAHPALAAAIDGDFEALAATGERGLLRVVTASHAGMTTDEFDAIVREWLDTARHPTTRERYTEMVYAPMPEVLTALRAAGFKTYIVSGGGVDFIRAFAEETYGIPPEQVIGSALETEWDPDARDVVRTPKIGFIDDKAGKPIGIQNRIGRRPIAAFGNSDGDLQMLQWTAAGEGPRLCVLIHHTDAEREWAYDRDSHIGRLDDALAEARAAGWTVVDMARDWSRVFPND